MGPPKSRCTWTFLCCSPSPLPQAINALHPVCTLGNIPGSHGALRTDGKHLRGTPVVCSSHVRTHAGRETEELCREPQPKPNLEDRVNIWPRAVLTWLFSGQQQSQSHSSWHNAQAVLQEKWRASFLFFKEGSVCLVPAFKTHKYQVILVEFTQQDKK